MVKKCWTYVNGGIRSGACPSFGITEWNVYILPQLTVKTYLAVCILSRTAVWNYL